MFHRNRNAGQTLVAPAVAPAVLAQLVGLKLTLQGQLLPAGTAILKKLKKQNGLQMEKKLMVGRMVSMRVHKMSITSRRARRRIWQPSWLRLSSSKLCMLELEQAQAQRH
jgi:hypothetical protein